MIKNLRQKIVNGGGMFMYLRSVGVSQISAYTDFLVSFVAFAWINLNSAWSTMLGAVAGGVVNCTLNYKVTFRPHGTSYIAIGVKFFMVWLGSITLNTVGTDLLNRQLQQSSIMDALGTSTDFRFLFARIFVSLIVSIFWNFMLQKYFVYSPSGFDKYVDRAWARIKPHRIKR